MEFYVLLVVLAVLGIVFGWVAFFRTNTIRAELESLRKELQAIRQTSGATTSSATTSSATTSSVTTGATNSPLVSPARSANTDAQATVASQVPGPAAATLPARKIVVPASVIPGPPPLWLSHLKQHWMVWLGGGCVGLAGIFLVKYSMDRGLLGPGARVLSALGIGLLLHAGAQWLFRHRQYHPAFAALAGGGSLTLFAAILAALHLYNLVSPVMAFAGLALVALGTMALALSLGPVLAILGLLGAYIVPALVGGGANGELLVLGYALIISAATLLLMRYLFRPWLWWGMLLGAALWFVLTLDSSAVAGFQGAYLCILGYLMLAVPDNDWLLRKQLKQPALSAGLAAWFKAQSAGEQLEQRGLGCLIVLQLLAVAHAPFPPFTALSWLLLAGLLLRVGGRRWYLLPHPLLLMFGQLGVLLLVGPGRVIEADVPGAASAWASYAHVHLAMLLSVAVFSGGALYNFRARTHQGVWIAMAVLAPLLFLALDWRLVPAGLHSMQWSWLAIALAAGYGTLAAGLLRKSPGTMVQVWLISGTHLGYSLAVALQVREASMTLALAVQLISLAWLIRRFTLPELGWLLKAVAAIVVVRLTMNPWLLSYPTDIHWSLWTYGGAFGCCAAAAWLLKDFAAQARWLTGAAMHLFALFCWAETRYWLYDGHVYAAQYTFVEASITLSIFAALSLIYHWRERASTVFAPLYRLYARVLLAGATLNYALIVLSTLTGLQWMRREIGATPIFNLLLLSFGAPVIWALCSWRLHFIAVRKTAGMLALVAAFIFINLEIHHLWQQRICLGCSKSSGELYTYSIIWLLLAGAGILGGIWRFGSAVYKAAMGLLLVVIAKLFLVDMAGLEGLWRVASFMGMGLGLLALAYLHQRLKPEQNS